MRAEINASSVSLVYSKRQAFNLADHYLLTSFVGAVQRDPGRKTEDRPRITGPWLEEPKETISTKVKTVMMENAERNDFTMSTLYR